MNKKKKEDLQKNARGVFSHQWCVHVILMLNINNLKDNPLFIQSIKDLESLGFIKINKDDDGNYTTVEIIDREGLQNYIDNFGKP